MIDFRIKDSGFVSGDTKYLDIKIYGVSYDNVVDEWISSNTGKLLELEIKDRLQLCKDRIQLINGNHYLVWPNGQKDLLD